MDSRLITNIREYTGSTGQIIPVEYTDRNSNKSRLGIVSQHLQAIDERLVQKSSTGYMVVDYNALVVVLLAKLNALEEKVKHLELKKGRK